MDFSFIEWICPLLQIGMSVKNQNRMANSVESDEMASGTTLFAQVSGLVCRDERVKL